MPSNASLGSYFGPLFWNLNQNDLTYLVESNICMYVCMYVRTYVRTYVCMYVCKLNIT